MAKFNVVDMNGQHVSEIELSDAVFGITPNEKAVHIAVVNFLANQRQGTQNTKIRMEVSGGGKKPWKQKGTGRARVGSIRSPLWVGGGTVFGPTPRSHAKAMPKKARQLAVKSALSEKLRANELVVIDTIHFDAPKTKEVVKMLSAFNAAGKALIVDGGDAAENTVLSARNIPGVKAYVPSGINIYDIVNYDKLFLTQEAVKKIEEVLA